MSTIVIGVDASERSEDAIVFGREMASAAGADVIVACAFPYSDYPSRAANLEYRHALAGDATRTAEAMRDRLGESARTVIVANASPAHALHDIAEGEQAALVVVGSTHTGHAGRVLPGSTGERLFHGAPCSVAVVPKDYRLRGGAIRRIGVAYNATVEASAAVHAAADLARALGAELEVIGVVSPESYATPALMGAPSTVIPREEVERAVKADLDEVIAELPEDITATATQLTGGPADTLTEYSAHLDLLVTGSRGYGPLRSVLVGGVAGRLVRSAQCPLIVVPRGVETPLGGLFGSYRERAAAAHGDRSS